MSTELVTFKMDKKFLKEVDETVTNAGFQNRTELIRAALREKVDDVKMKKAIMELSKFRGKAGKQTSDAQIRKIREQVSNKILAEHEKRFK